MRALSWTSSGRGTRNSSSNAVSARLSRRPCSVLGLTQAGSAPTAPCASLAGVSPIPASSGLTVRHRLNRRGDRQLNRALHVIVINRLRLDKETQAYVERRRAEGKTDREIKRCLKRYIARQIYRQLETAA